MTKDPETLRAVAEKRRAGCEREANLVSRNPQHYAEELARQMDFALATVPLIPLISALTHQDRYEKALREIDEIDFGIVGNIARTALNKDKTNG